MNDWTEPSASPRGSVQADIKALIATAWRRKWWLIGSVFVCSAIAVTVALMLPRIYRATTVLVASTPAAGVGGGLSSAMGAVGSLASLAGIDISPNGGKADEIIAVLTSCGFIERFISEKNLLSVLYADDWDQSTGTWKVGVRPVSLALACKFFKRDVLSVDKEKGSLIKLNIDWRNREFAAAWANELVARVNGEMRARALDEADKSVRFLEQESQRTTLVPTQQAISRLMESQINQRMLANVTEEYALRAIDKALPPDVRDPVSPRKVLILGSGVTIGLAVGLFLVWFSSDQPKLPGSGIGRADPRQ